MLTLLIVPAAALATTLELYHVNPLHEGVLPIDMDTADIQGDAFFDLRSKVVPIECASNETHGHDCDNGEVVDHDLVITKLSMNVKAAKFGDYGRCNICLPTGVDPFTGLPCTPGAYICTCGDYSHPKDCSNQTLVGAENITESFGKFRSWSCNWERWIKAPWTCWSWPVVEKTGGMWYSTTAAGWCGAPGADPDRCTWDATVHKVVNKSCSDGIIHGAVEEYDAKSGAGCFDACPSRKHQPHKRNTSDTCWIYCFHQTMLGPSYLLPSGGQLSGMPLELILAAFEKPFKPESAGGCPNVTAPALPLDPTKPRRGNPRRAALAAEMYRDRAAAIGAGGGR